MLTGVTTFVPQYHDINGNKIGCIAFWFCLRMARPDALPWRTHLRHCRTSARLAEWLLLVAGSQRYVGTCADER